MQKSAALVENTNAGRKRPLGNYVSQMEMTNPEVRRELREMLEFQMRERDREIQNDDSISGYQRKRQSRYSNERMVPIPPRTI